MKDKTILSNELMDEEYGRVLSRLKAERSRYKITQGEMSKTLKMTQSHYNKAESGKKRFGYYEVQGMCSSDVDIYHIFTGRCSRRKDYFENQFFESDFECMVICLKAINMVAGVKKRSGPDSTEWERIYQDTQYIEYAEYSIAEVKNIFKATRTYIGKTQIDMAFDIGVDVKKLRALECDETLPDSELIYRMYKLYRISPSIFLRDKKCLGNEICYLVDSADGDVRRKLIFYINLILENLR